MAILRHPWSSATVAIQMSTVAITYFRRPWVFTRGDNTDSSVVSFQQRRTLGTRFSRGGIGWRRSSGHCAGMAYSNGRFWGTSRGDQDGASGTHTAVEQSADERISKSSSEATTSPENAPTQSRMICSCNRHEAEVTAGLVWLERQLSSIVARGHLTAVTAVRRVCASSNFTMLTYSAFRREHFGHVARFFVRQTSDRIPALCSFFTFGITLPK